MTETQPGGGKIIGVLGGMGPLASAQFMLRLTLLTPAELDQDHVPAVLWSDPRVPARVAGQRGTGPDPLPWLVHGLHGLERAGCGAIAVPCNLAHAWIDGMRPATRLPILHIVDAAIVELDRQTVPPGRVGVMATAETLAVKLYQNRLEALGRPCLIPTQEEMAEFVIPAIADVKANRLADAYAPLATVVGRLRDRGARAIVLGCTEIPLGIQAGPSDILAVPIIDTIDALARAAVTWARS